MCLLLKNICDKKNDYLKIYLKFDKLILKYFFVECVDGFYNINCSGICGFCVNGEVCEKYEGYCLNGCKINYREFLC